MHTVFVYGTLKRGRSNFGLLKNSEFVHEARTSKSYKMVDHGPYPAVFERNDASLPVIGEVFHVDDRTLEALDQLEGHPNFYRRVEVPIVLDNGIHDTAWMYLCPRAEQSRSPEAAVQDGCYNW